ncbi:hypothetical protein ACH46N_10325 [Streptomyces pristinaespiralis]|uniref:Uncharacterized protein n=2 Tax=Streptomyces pristinaespiralis TaxID=38300 RepID=B5HCE4_STRE2|nr:hypothetical protein [Streptomyces pristinaespiralis]ALC23116.1 hypothetical protein SPRI_4810 [Streptomyces pristinaespiralis]EDY64505.2 conserved hypothetical protein [Streptomyces pristinaespiralis ATCC 25486]QMU14367.1 hypothetical protein H3L99_12775 [Streptomyces pristinaespiralis]
MNEDAAVNDDAAGDMRSDTDMRLGDALRREADAVPVGPAPVDGVLRRGRAARRRRTAAMAGGVTALVAVLAVVPLSGELTRRHTPSPPATAPPVTALPTAVRTVGPYEPEPIGRGHSMALLPDGAQNYVVGAGDIAESVDAARGYTGDNIGPESLSGGRIHDGELLLHHGAFRTRLLPARIEVRTDSGARSPASALRLPGEPGWGAYYAFGDASTADEGWTVTAYGADGGVLAERYFGAVSGP